jgi:hypothetical protein
MDSTSQQCHCGVATKITLAQMKKAVEEVDRIDDELKG